MKKVYMRPEMQVVEVCSQQMIAASNSWGNEGGEGDVTEDFVDPL